MRAFENYPIGECHAYLRLRLYQLRFAKDVMQKNERYAAYHLPRMRQGDFAKQLTAAGFQLKGSGYYVTDFKNGSQPKPKPEAASAPCASAGCCPVASGNA